MCSTRQSFFSVKLDLKCYIKGRGKTREIKKKKYFFLKWATWPPVLAQCAMDQLERASTDKDIT